MSGYRLSAPHGRWVERGKPLRFQFNGRSVHGFAGDTIASALLAQGIVHVGRSFKLHRPRGIFSCGVEEPTGLVDVGTGSRRTPNTRVTDVLARDGMSAVSCNCWPNLRFDTAALTGCFSGILPAGFYYKTFTWPNWGVFEPVIRRMAGLGIGARDADPSRYDEISVSTDVLVIGAGAAGMQAALAAAQNGKKVLLLEADPHTGGWLGSQTLDVRRDNGGQILMELAQALRASDVEIKTRCTAVALYDHQLVVAIECVEDTALPGAIRERLWKIRARHIVLATGAFERPMLFPDNDRPGVMLGGSVERYAAHFGVACGKRIIIATASDSAYGVAQSLVASGIDIAAIVDRRSARDVGSDALAPAGVRVLHDSGITGVSGSHAVRSVSIMNGGATEEIEADIIASSGGHTPNVNLYSQAGGRLKWIEQSSMFVPECALPGVTVVGACAGVFNLVESLAHADTAGRTACSGVMPAAPAPDAGVVPADTRLMQMRLAPAGRLSKQFVDLQNDVVASDIALAAIENYRSVEHLKRYTTTGMATDQGKTSNINALILMAQATGRTAEQVGTTKFRPPFKPVTLNALAGGRSGERYRCLKRLVAHAFHVERAALFEEFGGWERPAAYPRGVETLQRAAIREAAAIRQAVGIFDGSPLGKIELYGPDAAALLDLMYVGTMSTLPVGSARYGALLDENGVIIDDGIVARLGPLHFWVNTTSTGAERAALAFEEWLQCEFPDWAVFVSPVTSQWGNVTVSGPKAWQLLKKVGLDPALAPDQMKHMTMRQTAFLDRPIRVLRASFNGELSYEINVPASLTESVIRLLWEAGQEFDVSMYGVEALMIMRIEKGFIHVGADTDGTTLPQDVGLARAVEKKAANFVGRRSLTRPAGTDRMRSQLVGLIPVDRHAALAVGAQLSDVPPPATADGFVTSSCDSPAMGHPVALAMLQRGTQRVGEKLKAWHLGKTVEVEVVKTPFFDPAGEKLNG